MADHDQQYQSPGGQQQDSRSHEPQQAARQQAKNRGSGFASMLGWVTEEDRQRWNNRREADKDQVNAVKQGLSSAAHSLMEFGRSNVNAQLSAVHKVHQEQKWESENARIVESEYDPRTRTTRENVSYQARQPEGDLEF